MMRSLIIGSVAAAAMGCVASQSAAQRGYPLYPQSGGRPAGSQVAQLSVSLPIGGSPSGGATSFIKTVDGREVSSLDRAFELLPGCHVVTTESQLLITNETMTWSGPLAPRAFVFQMKPGHEYLVVVELVQGMSSSAQISIYGAEQDPTGKRTKTIEPVAPTTAQCGPGQ